MFIVFPDAPTTKVRRGALDSNTIRIINDYIDDFSSGENDSEESGSEDEEEAEKAQETAKILAVSTVGITGRKSQKSSQNNEQYQNDDESGDKTEEPSESDDESGDYTDELDPDEVDGMAEPVIESDNESDKEQVIDTRSKVPTPRLALYNGTNDFDEPSQLAKDSLGLTEISDVKEVHVNGPSAYYTKEGKEDAALSRSYIEDPDALPSDNSATEVNSLWNDAQVAEEKLANIPYPTDDSTRKFKLFMNEDGVNKGEPTERKSLGEGMATEHKKLISDVMQNVNGGKTIGEKFASKVTSIDPNARALSDGIPVIRAMNTRKVSTSGKQVGGKGKSLGKDTDEEKMKASNEKDKAHKVKNNKESQSKDKEKSQEHQERETYHKLKLSVKEQKRQPIKNKTWEAEVNALFPGKTSDTLAVPVHDIEASTGLRKTVPTLGKPSKKHSVDKANEAQTTSRMIQRLEKQKPTAKETRTDNVAVSTKRQCLGLSLTDCIGSDSVTFNLPLNGPVPMGVQVDNLKSPDIVYPPGAGFNYQNGFQPPNQYSPGMRQYPAIYPSSANAEVQQQFGGLPLMNGYDNQPHDYPGAFPDHYPNNLPNMPQSSPIENKNRPKVPTMKPSENSIFKGGIRKKKKSKKHKTTTPKPKKTTTTKCPDCEKTKESSGGKKIPLPGKLRKVKKKTTTTTVEPPQTTPNTTPVTTER